MQKITETWKTYAWILWHLAMIVYIHTVIGSFYNDLPKHILLSILHTARETLMFVAYNNYTPFMWEKTYPPLRTAAACHIKTCQKSAGCVSLLSCEVTDLLAYMLSFLLYTFHERHERKRILWNACARCLKLRADSQSLPPDKQQINKQVHFVLVYESQGTKL